MLAAVLLLILVRHTTILSSLKQLLSCLELEACKVVRLGVGTELQELNIFIEFY